ncbi:hypothetical protein CHELA20_51644 [Hyphomicrobiales bacterium]|nr:hypothetical protein CHELA41_23369 [Hyphomicrobiales bacterium]CAH1677495.1 hypothetical protein CHELA20_51644 [Hyphomicrobiales bacterium]
MRIALFPGRPQACFLDPEPMPLSMVSGGLAALVADRASVLDDGASFSRGRNMTAQEKCPSGASPAMRAGDSRMTQSVPTLARSLSAPDWSQSAMLGRGDVMAQVAARLRSVGDDPSLR